MKLQVDLRAIDGIARRMGADTINVGRILDDGGRKLDPIDIELSGRGIEVPLSEIEVSADGRLGYRGRQVVLYIQDHGWNVAEVVKNGEAGKKFHIADCGTLEDMRQKGRFERYVVRNDTSEYFYITGTGGFGYRKTEGNARLKVCKNCLKKLFYQEYSRDPVGVFSNFDLKEFFQRYESNFISKPSRIAGQFDGGYSEDWERISTTYKRNRDFTCEKCRVNLRSHIGLLHVHHIDGVKTNNRPSNLKALCAICHSGQPDHEHMHISRQNREAIMRLRHRQQV